MAQHGGRDPNPGYWEVPSTLQHAKHGILAEYLKRWLPIMTSWAGTVCYIETHAGKGVHDDGQPGSPTVALRTILSHSKLDEILARSRVRCQLIESDKDNLDSLRQQLAMLSPRPDRIVVDEPYLGDWRVRLPEVLRSARGEFPTQPPALLFVDPYSWEVEYSFLRQIMSKRGMEVLVLVVWRELDMALGRARQDQPTASILDSMFLHTSWVDISNVRSPLERVQAGINLIRQEIAARWATPALLLGENRAVRNILLHLTNNDRGRDEMKAAMRKVCPSYDGRFIARRSDNPEQGRLFTDKVASHNVENWVLSIVKDRPRRWRELLHLARRERWVDSDVNAAVRTLCQRRILEPTDFSGTLGPKADPLLVLRRES